MYKMNRMSKQVPGRVTAQQKLMDVASKLGNKSLAKQQGSTVELYDTLPLNGNTQLDFFKGANSRNFPFTNTGSDGNKLPVGYAMVVQYAYFTICTLDKLTGQFTKFEPVSTAGTSPSPLILNGTLDINIANVRVLKELPVLSFMPDFNPDAENALSTNYEFKTLITIQELLEYIATLRLPNYTGIDDTYLRLTIQGAGAIINTRTTF